MVPVFLQTLGKRNPALFYFGWACLAASLVTGVCFLLDAAGSTWIRPTRFLFSTTIFVWTIGWLLDALHEQKKLLLFSVALILILLFENGYTVIFAMHEASTHNHIAPGLDAWMIRMMEIGVGIISVWTAWFTWLFFTRPLPDIKRHYLWGIRFGLLFFVVFSLSGNLMAVLPGWNVASPNGGGGTAIRKLETAKPGTSRSPFSRHPCPAGIAADGVLYQPQKHHHDHIFGCILFSCPRSTHAGAPAAAVDRVVYGMREYRI